MKNLLISSIIALVLGLFIAFKIWEYGAREHESPPMQLQNGGGALLDLPPIDATFGILKKEIRDAVAERGRGMNPFFTDFFEAPSPPPPPPPPLPPPAPLPPPETVTVQVPVVYMGFFETTAGMRRAYIRREGELLVLGLNDAVLGEWKIGAIESDYVLLQNPAGEELRLEFNHRRQIDIQAPNPELATANNQGEEG